MEKEKNMSATKERMKFNKDFIKSYLKNKDGFKTNAEYSINALITELCKPYEEKRNDVYTSITFGNTKNNDTWCCSTKTNHDNKIVNVINDVDAIIVANDTELRKVLRTYQKLMKIYEKIDFVYSIQLPPKYKMILTKVYVEKKTIETIGEELEKSRTALYSSLNKGINAIYEYMTEEERVFVYSIYCVEKILIPEW